jgi:hypothetical protein
MVQNSWGQIQDDVDGGKNQNLEFGDRGFVLPVAKVSQILGVDEKIAAGGENDCQSRYLAIYA